MVRHEIPPRPTAKTLELLTGKISDPIQVAPDKTARLVLEGTGMAGLTDVHDNREWSGIFHHLLLSTSIAHSIATQLCEKGYSVDPSIILHAGINSHLGRRIWDEAKRYPDSVKDSAQKLTTTNESIGVNILEEEIGTDSPIYQTVAALAHGVEADPTWYESLEYKIFSYVDHRTTDAVYEYHERMGGFLLGAFIPQDQINDEVKQAAKQMVKDIFQEVKQGQTISLETAIARAKAVGADETSDRLRLDSFMSLIIEDAETEKMFEKAGIDLTDLNETPSPRWERYLRRLYIMDAEQANFGVIDKAREPYAQQLEATLQLDGLEVWEQDLSTIIHQAVPQGKWGANAIEELYIDHAGKPYESRNKSSRPLIGWARAIAFFNYLDNQEKEPSVSQKSEKSSGSSRNKIIQATKDGTLD